MSISQNNMLLLIIVIVIIFVFFYKSSNENLSSDDYASCGKANFHPPNNFITYDHQPSASTCKQIFNDCGCSIEDNWNNLNCTNQSNNCQNFQSSLYNTINLPWMDGWINIKKKKN